MKDPICGMQVDKENAVKLKHNNRTYYFCCENCKKKFLAQGPSKEPQRPQTKNIYTCPMHPEISSGEPGDCPKCGMRLEPKLPPAEQEDDNNEEKVAIFKVLGISSIDNACCYYVAWRNEPRI